LPLRIDHGLVVNMDEQDLPQHQAEASQRDFLHERAFHRNGRLGDARNGHTLA
jgi:hypothetical protein